MLRHGKVWSVVAFCCTLIACGGGGAGGTLPAGADKPQSGIPLVIPSQKPTATPSASPAPTATPMPTSTPRQTPPPTPTPQPTQTPGVPTFHGCPVFAAGDAYNAVVTNNQIDPNSQTYINAMNSNGANGGFAVYDINPSPEQANLADSSTQTYTVNVRSTHTQDFPLPMPWESSFFLEPQGDHHAIVVDTATCELYESYGTSFSNNTLSAYSGWEWDMTQPFVGTSKNTPPQGTSNPSAVASGLSILAGAIRAEDVQAGAIHHALNFAPPAGSIGCSAIVWPATSTGGCDGQQAPPVATPYGSHFRLKSSFQLTCGSSCPQAQMIASAMKTYGIYISDTGGKGTVPQLSVMTDANGPNPFNGSDIRNIDQIHITDFDVIDN